MRKGVVNFTTNKVKYSAELIEREWCVSYRNSNLPLFYYEGHKDQLPYVTDVYIKGYQDGGIAAREHLKESLRGALENVNV